jgi:hypothetical protein
MEVLMHTVMPRTPPVRPPLIPPPPPRPVAQKKKKKTQDTRYPLPPVPSPPGPPENWLEISQRDLPRPEPEPPKPVLRDDWTLVRVPSGQVGWVLTSRLYMTIPDEVAQYSEGHRITSYFSLGEVPVGDETKHHWLWTTTRGGLHEHDFDSFRVFIWNVRRNRYETAYIDRRVRGYFPVELHPVTLSSGGRAGGATYPGFSLCVEKDDGERYRRSYAFVVNVLRFAGEGPCAPPPPIPTEPPRPEDTTLVASNDRPTGTLAEIPVYGRFLERISDTARRWLGRQQPSEPAEPPEIE